MKPLLSFLAAMVFFTSSWAQGDVLTLQQAVETAHKNNTDINQLKARIEAKKNQWRLVSGVDAPEFTFAKEGIGEQEGPDFAEQRLAITQGFDFPLTTAYRLQALKKDLKALHFDLEEQKRELKTSVKKQYVRIVYALYKIDLHNRQIELADELHNAAYSRAESGVGNDMEVMKAEIRKAEAKNMLDNAQRLLHQGRYGLFKLLGMEIKDQSYAIQFEDTLRTYQERIDQDKALNYLEEQPAYKAVQLRQEAAQKRVREAKSNILPDISFSYLQQDFGQGYDFHGFEFGISLPLWLPLQHKGEVQTARAEKTRLQWKQQGVKLRMKERIERAWHGYENSLSTLHRYDSTIRDKAENLQQLTLEGYRIGEIDLLNLLDAQQTYLRTQQRYLEALRDHYLQIIELEKYIGQEIVY
ncbi:MAG: TolC family protein [Bacteroidales bacterium]|nr:TolC family protein [Bacteroidales bacterium]MCF8333555.1 TolC family protein [Bacteroidales bacterium]